MKKLFMIALLSISILGVAQKKNEKREQMTPEQRVEKMSSKMKENYGLSEEQTNEVKAVLLKKAEKNASKREEIKANREERKKIVEEIKAENELTKEELKKILTPEQYAKYEEKQSERKEKMKEKIKERKANRKNKSEK